VRPPPPASSAKERSGRHALAVRPPPLVCQKGGVGKDLVIFCIFWPKSEVFGQNGVFSIKVGILSLDKFSSLGKITSKQHN
jgi:hypothetical protein